MEKNIKILEWFIELCKHNELGFDKEVQAIESLIKGYKDLEEENNSIKYLNEGLKLDKKILTDMVNDLQEQNRTLKGFVSEVFNEGDDK